MSTQTVPNTDAAIPTEQTARVPYRKVITALTEVAEHAARIRQLEAELRAERQALVAAIRATEGLPVQANTLAAVSQLSRQRIYQIRAGIHQNEHEDAPDDDPAAGNEPT